MTITPLQRGRASFQFLGELARFSGRELQERARTHLEGEMAGAAWADDGLKRIREANVILDDCFEHQYDRLVTQLVADEIFQVGLASVEEVETEVDEEYRINEEQGGALELDRETTIPAYWQREFHLAPGGWDGHEKMGYVIHEFIYPYVFSVGGVGAVQAGRSFTDHRTQVAAEGRKSQYDRMLELGVGTGRFLMAFQELHPGAELYGVDLSSSELRHTHLVAGQKGFTWQLRRAAAEHTGFDDDYFDIVVAFTLLHEVPMSATKEIIAEAFRVLKPEGEFIIGDVAPYRLHTPYQAAIMDWETEHRGEPYWRAALMFDRAGALRDAGFVDVEEYGLGETHYPWITRGVKPRQ